MGLGVDVGEDIRGGGRLVDGNFVAPVDRDVRDGLGLFGPPDQFGEALSGVARVGADRDPDSPSRTTVKRILGRTEAENWSRTVERRYQSTPGGSRVLDAYRDLGAVIEQVIEKAPWFQRFDPRLADVPVREFRNATLLVPRRKIRVSFWRQRSSPVTPG